MAPVFRRFADAKSSRVPAAGAGLRRNNWNPAAGSRKVATPMRRKRIALAAVLLLVVATILFVARKDPYVVVFPHGRAVLRQVRFAQTDTFVMGNFWQRMLARLLPAKAAARLTVRSITSFPSSNAVLIAWIEATRDTPPLTPAMALTVSDASGLESARVPPDRVVSSASQSVYEFKLPVVPRHSDTISLRLYDGTTNTLPLLAGFKLANPARTNSAPPPADPLPQMRRDGDQEFTLVAVNSGLQSTGLMRAHGGMWTELLFRIGTNEPGGLGTNPPSFSGWQIRTIDCIDSVGNHIVDRMPHGRVASESGSQIVWRSDDGVATIAESLWPEEAWKIRVQFSRGSMAKLPPPCTVTFHGIPIPAAGETNALTTSTQLFGSTITLLSVQTATNLPASPGRATMRRRIPITLRAKFDRADPMQDLLFISAVDQRGSNVFGAGGLPNRQPTEVHLGALSGATSLDVTFGISRFYSAEYLVRPGVLRTNVAHWPPIPAAAGE